LLPQDAGPGALQGFAQSWTEQFKADGAPELGVVFESPPDDPYGCIEPCSELVKRTVEFWSLFGPGTPFDASGSLGGGAPGAWLPKPWTQSEDRRRVLPRPQLAAWSNLARQLAFRRVVGMFPVAPGVRAYILAPGPGAPAGRTGAIVA